MPNDHIKSEISAYLAGGLTESRNRQIETHLAACEKCQQAMNKVRAKQARQKREALKKASPDPLPNLFLARQGKETGMSQPAAEIPWFLIVVLLLAGGSYLLFRHFSGSMHPVNVSAPEEASIAVSSATVDTTTVASVTAPTPEAPSSDDSLQVQGEWKGVDSAIQSPRVVVVRSKDGWEKLWTEMQVKEPLPSVNFGKHLVVGVFAGESPGGATIILGHIREEEDEVRIPYQVTGAKEKVSGGPTHPYLLSLLRRVDKKIRLTEREAQP